MDKVLEFEKNGKRYSVVTDGFSKNEIYVDGAYEIAYQRNIAKLRFYSTTGVVSGSRRIVECKISLVMNDQAMIELYDLLGEVIQNEQSTSDEKPSTDREDNQEQHEEQNTEYVEIFSVK